MSCLRMVYRLPIVWLCLMTVLARPAAAEAAKNFIATPQAAQQAVARIVEMAGRLPRVLVIDIAPDNVSVTAQGPDKSWHLEHWSLAVVKLWVLSKEVVSGPQVVQAPGPVDDVESGLFDLTDIRLGDAAVLAEAAIARAGLEDAATVTSMRIERRVSILPKPSYGDIHWTIEVVSPYERATVYANAASEITGADLSQTHRAKMLNLLAGDWPTGEAQRALAAVIGSKPIVYRVDVSHSTLAVDAESPSDPKQLRTYSWDLSGVRRGLVDMPNMDKLMGSSNRAPFSFDELDLVLVPMLIRQARERLEMPKGEVTSMTATSPTVGVNAAALEWQVEVTDGNGDKGLVKADAVGKIIDVVLPQSRRPAAAWLAPETIRATLTRIDKSFGHNARFIEISINDERGNIVAEDPLKPGANAEFTVDQTEITRFGMPFDKHFHDEEAFTMAEATRIDAGGLKAMMDETIRRMKLADGQVARVTFSRGNVFVQAPRGLITVEVRLETPDGSSGGRVTFDANGRVIDVVEP
jgi:hypothetical protein